VVGTGEDDALGTLAPRGFVQVVQAADVGLQDGLEGPFDGHAAQVHDGVDALQQRQHRGRVGQLAGHAPHRRRHVQRRQRAGQVGQGQAPAQRGQRRGQHAAQQAGGASQQEAVDGRGGAQGRPGGLMSRAPWVGPQGTTGRLA